MNRQTKPGVVVCTVVSAILLWCAGCAHTASVAKQVPSDPWPRTYELDDAVAVVYQPQIDSWKGNLIEFRSVIAVKPNGATQETYGVIWATARTEVDRVARMVGLQDLTLTRTSFPTRPDQGRWYLSELREHFGPSKRSIALDRLEAAFAASGTARPATVQIKTDPPPILVSFTPAILVTIGGKPVLRPVPDTRLARVINTRALILREQGSSNFYLHVYDGWLHAGAVEGPWYQSAALPPGIDQAAGQLATSGVVDLIDGGNAQPKPSLASGVPTIFVSETPAELLLFKGEPTFSPIEGTHLSWASNTASDVVLDTETKEYFVLLSGRWYRTRELTGPWTYVASTSLPADFRKIPVTSPAAVVLAAVAGTPQAQEAVIANSIPQTATVPLANPPKFTATFDGAPQFRSIDGTPLAYAVNAPTPIIRVDASTYYALQAGVWYVATSPGGPWTIATSVPAVIYTIPPASALHYVTYVQVYGATPEVVYMGYTPGYMGTVVAPDGVVVYGTGYTYEPWVGTVYYPPPATYGVMAQPVYNPAVGMAYGYALGVETAAVAESYGATAYYHPAYYGYPCCGSTSASVYGSYGSTTYSGTRTYYDSSSGTYGTTASGTYKNQATGTTGTYQASKSYNPYTGQEQASTSRTATTPEGGSGQVSRSAEYNTQTGEVSRSGSATATGAGGRSESVSGSASSSGNGQAQGEVSRTSSNENTGMSKTTTTTAGTGQTPSRETTVSDSKTGQSKTYSSGEAYASKSGDVYRQSGSGWEQHTSSGWQSATGDTSWADKEQQARSQGEDRHNSFQEGGGGGWGGRSGGGGWGGRSGGSRR